MTTLNEPTAGVTTPVDRLRLCGPEQLLEGIPYLLGFRPTKSVVMLALAPPRRRVRVTMRLDLDAPPEMADTWFAAAEREGCQEVVVVVYDDELEPQSPQHRERVDQWGLQAITHSLSITEVLAVARDRWWSFHCQNPRCCPESGHRLATDESVAARAVSYGLVAAKSRSDLEAELEPSGVRVQAVTTAIGELGESYAQLLRGEPGHGSVRIQRAASLRHLESMFAGFVSNDADCSPSDAAPALLSLADVKVRDAMIASVPPDGGETAMNFWRDLTRCAPPSFAAAPATLFAMCAFAGGDGARANIGIVRALSDRADYRLAELLDSAVSGGIRPSLLVPELVAGALKERRKLLRRARRPRGTG